MIQGDYRKSKLDKFVDPGTLPPKAFFFVQLCRKVCARNWYKKEALQYCTLARILLRLHWLWTVTYYAYTIGRKVNIMSLTLKHNMLLHTSKMNMNMQVQCECACARVIWPSGTLNSERQLNLLSSCVCIMCQGRVRLILNDFIYYSWQIFKSIPTKRACCLVWQHFRQVCCLFQAPSGRRLQLHKNHRRAWHLKSTTLFTLSEFSSDPRTHPSYPWPRF